MHKASSEKRKSVSASTPVPTAQPTMLDFAQESGSSLASSKKHTNYVSNNEIAATLIEHEGSTSENNSKGVATDFDKWKCMNPRCKGKIINCVKDKGVTNALSHLKSKRCYGGLGIDTQARCIIVSQVALCA